MSPQPNLTEEGKKKYAEVQIERILHIDNHRASIILSRYQGLTIISGLATAMIGVVISTTSSIINNCLAIASILILIVPMLLGLYVFLWKGKKYSKYLLDLIEEAPKLDCGEKSKIEEVDLLESWPEYLYYMIVFGIFLFLLSFFLS